MKKVIYGVMAFAALTFTACGGAENTEETKVEEEKAEEKVMAEYLVDSSESTLEWKGSWVGGENDGKSHNGVVKITDGKMVQEGDQFHGKFAIDMSSIDVQDLDETSGKPKLQGHLANEDFFNVSKYTYTEVQVMEVIEGNAKIMLNVAGTQMERTVPVSIDTNDDSMTIEGDFEIDFTDANMPGMQVDPEKPEEGAVSTIIEFELDAKLMKK